MPVEGWFATPVYYNYVADKNAIQSEISKVYNASSFGQVEGWGNSTHYVSDPTFNSNIIEQHNLVNLEQEIKHNVAMYTAELGGDVTKKFKIASCWLTRTKPGEYTRIHNHGYSDVSGVYYFKTNGNDGDLVLVAPYTNLTSMPFAKILDTVTYKPEEGKMVLFPGWLNHTVSENDTNDERISVSFNVYFDR